eukprot:gb/GECG01012514.1/.p1 GENE.gb/GECG01012514.1/~~gb/GECG01012514.1/.p1  ORF type:complete len:160 (+),score=5.34 gb/GECG01012514.1/:1-480(+)
MPIELIEVKIDWTIKYLLNSTKEWSSFIVLFQDFVTSPASCVLISVPKKRIRDKCLLLTISAMGKSPKQHAKKRWSIPSFQCGFKKGSLCIATYYCKCSPSHQRGARQVQCRVHAAVSAAMDSKRLRVTSVRTYDVYLANGPAPHWRHPQSERRPVSVV